MSVNRHKNGTVPELELGMLQMQILWLLKRPTHGYALMKALNELKQTKVTQGTLYPTLQRLEELGLIARKHSARRHVWHLTAKGRTAMRRACGEFCATFQGIFRDFVCGRCR
ncbi:MAG: PadR family transcriptional regulator [Candidatus Aenigmatarchaeota archaeon]